MEAMRSTWTDSRLDDLNGRVGGIADEVKELRKDVRELRGEFGALQRTMIQVGGGLVGTLLVGMLGLIATQL
jgi:phage-related protein